MRLTSTAGLSPAWEKKDVNLKRPSKRLPQRELSIFEKFGTHGNNSNAGWEEKPKACSFFESNMHPCFDSTEHPPSQLCSQITRNKRLCFNCLSSQHRTRECQSKPACRKCSKRHRTSLCFPQSANIRIRSRNCIRQLQNRILDNQEDSRYILLPTL